MITLIFFMSLLFFPSGTIIPVWILIIPILIDCYLIFNSRRK